ncbi:hypothetical protein CDL12_07161 [Handroanthus impetiginosus]|uniref:Uncharacterized protein n=1 Tax=Handroanthus impetiginosus TaxID=429701 RepID=A0A2G9HRJ5_9LAMI|nr:hypothetical protein CDL12_07161 [Handroanthus impetiginosus]
MEVELVTDETSEDENYVLDDNSEDYLNFEGERCGICMDVVIDRGVLDCCPHWFCFACIDNWATITSLCPLCQNEFQLITCVPVHDTVGGNKTDDDINPRDDDWFIEGKNNTLSFPSYYIDENAVVCLDGDGCKIRSGSVSIEGDPDIDTSIACDSCDKWYHAFCVGFDPEGTCDGSWLCPRCTINKGLQKSDRVSIPRKSYQSGVEIADGDCPTDASFSGRVSVSVADDGETAVVISLIEGNQETQESNESVVRKSRDMESTLSSTIYNMPKSEALPGNRSSVEHNTGQEEMEVSLSCDNCYGSSHSKSPARLNDAVNSAPIYVNNKMVNSGLDLDLGLLMDSDMKDSDRADNHVPGAVERNGKPADPLPAENMVPNEMEVLSLKSMTPDKKESITGISGAKRKHRDSRNADVGVRESNVDAKFSRKKIKAERNSQLISLVDQTAVSDLDQSNSSFSGSSSRDGTFKCKSEKENGTSDIMDIVQGTDRKSLKQLGHKNSSNKAVKESESVAGLRLKKIMRRAGDDKDSQVLVQELRKKIREAVRNKPSEEVGRKLFDPKLLDAFRAALAGSGAENRKPAVDLKAKRSLLQKGKVRESLTKKIYGTGGKRRRAWTRECEVEFWKHRCIKTSKPEKIQTLKSVLDLLRDNSDNSRKKIPGNEGEAKGSILSRLYLADTSVFPRQNDIKPVSVLKAVAAPEEKRESGLTDKVSTPLRIDQSVRIPQKQNSVSQVSVPPLDDNGAKKSVKDMKAETASIDAHQKRNSRGASSPALGDMKVPSEKDMTSKSDIKGDKRKWALEVLARRTAASATNTQAKEEDNMILKGNYPLLAQLPKEMRPVLAPSHHNKVPASIRQAQLYRLTEHFLKKANLSVVCGSAEMELAVADAVNIEKLVADRSNSKLVYLNLCSQELLRRSDDVNSDRAKEAKPCSTSDCLSDEVLEENNNSSLDLEVDEALKKTGLMSGSPPNSPKNPMEDINNEVGSLEKTDEEGPDNVIEVDSHPELDIYGDFEYNLEDDDFIGAGSLNISKLQPDPPKIKMLFSSLKPEKLDGIPDHPDHDVPTDVEALAGSSGVTGSENKTTGGSTVDGRVEECLLQNSSVDSDEECEELYGPDKEPLIQKYPDAVSMAQFEQNINNELPGGNGDYNSNYMQKNSQQSSEDHAEKLEVSLEKLEVTAADGSKQSPSNVQERENMIKMEKTTKCDTKQPEHSSMVMKKVEAYIKEHMRPLCKSGVITVEQYRWAVAKTTEKVMKYHSKEKNANFLIKEGEKVKKLAEQYVEAAQHKAKT